MFPHLVLWYLHLSSQGYSKILALGSLRKDVLFWKISSTSSSVHLCSCLWFPLGESMSQDLGHFHSELRFLSTASLRVTS